MNKNLSLVFVLSMMSISAYGMEQPKNLLKQIAHGVKKNTEKRKHEESDGYDTELIESPTLKRNDSFKRNFQNIKYYQCSICTKSNDQFWNIKKHILRNHHDQPEVRIKEINPDGTVLLSRIEGLGTEYICDCGKNYFDKYVYIKHCKEKNHPLDKKFASYQKKARLNEPPTDDAPFLDPVPLDAQQESVELVSAELIEQLFNDWVEPNP